MPQQARRERPIHKPIPQPYAEDCARKNRSSSPSTMGESTPAAPQVARAIANVLWLPVIPEPSPGPNQAIPTMQVRKDRSLGQHQTAVATLQMWERPYCLDRRGPEADPTLF